MNNIILIVIVLFVQTHSFAQSFYPLQKVIEQKNDVKNTNLKESNYYINFLGNQIQLSICHNSKKIIDSTGKDFILFYYPKYLTGDTVIRKISMDYFYLKIAFFRNTEFESKLNYLKFLANSSLRKEPKIFTIPNNIAFVFCNDVLRSNKNLSGIKSISKTILINPVSFPYGIELNFLYLTNEGFSSGIKPSITFPQFEFSL
jgi:hypothetical protein